MIKIKYKTKRKIEIINLKINDFINNILCYPINILEKIIKSKIKKIKNKNHPNIYQNISIENL